MNVMVFAAGFGTRMLPLTNDRPKPLIEVAGRPLIDHARSLIRPANPTRVIANLHYKAKMLADHLAGTEVACITEQPRILDTGGGLRNAMPMLGRGPVYTLNPDAIWCGPNPLLQLASTWDPGAMDAVMMCIPVDQARGHAGTGDFAIDPDGRLNRGAGLVYSGLQIIRTDGLEDFGGDVFSLNAVWDRMQARGRLFGVVYDGEWCDVGSPSGIAVAEQMMGHGHV